MAAFASCRRSGAVRVMVLLLCALFIFSTLGAPAAQALGVESVAVFGLASVLSAATAALGFKLASNQQGQATLQKMVQDFKTVAWATGFVLVGSKLNGLQNGMDYIKMQVQNGKTYLDARVFAWVQQWLAENGVYSSSASIDSNIDVSASGSLVSTLPRLSYVEFYNFCSSVYDSQDMQQFNSLISQYSIDFSSYSAFEFYKFVNGVNHRYYYIFCASNTAKYQKDWHWEAYSALGVSDIVKFGDGSPGSIYNDMMYIGLFTDLNSKDQGQTIVSNIGRYVSGNDTGLSGTDTLGKDVIDLTLDQILQKLKEWAQDWFDAGADSATNAATGAKDLPLTVATGAATANPSIAEDGPLVWFPSFDVPIPTLRTGETDTNTVDQGKDNANTVDKTEAAVGTVEETQTIVDSLLNWASDYISPDNGLFSKFPLCIPYDAYLLVCSALGVDALGVDDVVGSSPGDVQSVMGSGVEVYSNFQPVINFKHELKAGGTTYPIAFNLDLTPFEPIVKLNRIFVTVYVLAELIASEYKRIRSS